MKIAFVTIGLENIGVEYLAGYLKANGRQEIRVFHHPGLFEGAAVLSSPMARKFFDYDRKIIQDVTAYAPDVIGFSVMSPVFRWSLDIASALKRSTGATIVYGGTHATLCPEETLQHDFIDFVIRGEGEAALVALLAELEGERRFERTPNLSWREGGVNRRNDFTPPLADVTSIPWADRTVYEAHWPFKTAAMATSSRGCPYKCTYCEFVTIRKEYKTSGVALKVRRRTPEDFVAELEAIVNKYGTRMFYFVDPIFAMNEPWILKFSELYRERVGTPFRCLGHPLTVTENIAAALARAGCKIMEIGVQSVNADNRNTLLKRSESQEEIAVTLALLRKHGIASSVDYIFFPWETETDHQYALDYFLENRPANFGLFRFVFFPKTDITQWGLQNGYLTEDHVKSLNQGYLAGYYDKGSFLDEGHLKKVRAFEILFHSLPFLPDWVARKLKAPGWMWLLSHVPLVPFLYVRSLIFGLLRIPSDDYSYLSAYYLKNIVPLLRWRLLGR